MNRSPLSRRNFLRASGVAIGLPLLPSLEGRAAENAPAKRRLVAINVGLGLHAPNIIPAASGAEYEPPIYLKALSDFRDQFTVISGTSHPQVGGGHISYKSYLTAARHPNSAGFRNTISIDQLAAEHVGVETRFASLALSSSGPSLSWSRSGVEVPAETRPSQIFKRLFLSGKPEEKAAQLQRLRDGRSILDVVLDKTKQMQRRISGRDRQKLDQFFGAVRDAELRLAKAQAWQRRPKPQVDVELPQDVSEREMIVERMGQMYDMMHLAIQTDSTRLITYNFTGMNSVPKIAGIDVGYHNLSHHGKDPAKIKQLTIIETEVMKSLAGFLKKLSAEEEGGDPLLDRTMVLFGSNLGNASSHDTRNMPIILAGGGFKHGSHLAFDRQSNYPLPNLYLSMLQRLGLEVDRFATSTGTMTGLELS